MNDIRFSRLLLNFRQLNNAKALEQAKSNVELHFRVVGVLEQLNCTLRVAEQRIGTFFSGVQQLYFNELLGKTTKQKCGLFPLKYFLHY